jgi:hypothetical protein
MSAIALGMVAILLGGSGIYLIDRLFRPNSQRQGDEGTLLDANYLNCDGDIDGDGGD